MYERDLGFEIVEARYVEIVKDDRVVQVAEHVPTGISAEDHAAGMRSSLEKLAAYLEGPCSIRGTREPSG